ncbi:heme biosynthesis protein HemY [Sneathiella sp.]|uniref:heme biosynthesis protein HemY n=1 Tax=Sneathiella sp. TaxID=1964365 RepID=UPI003563AE21
MMRAVFVFIFIALLAFGAVWLSDYPGDVRLTWGGYQVETSIIVVAALALVFAVIVALIYRFWVWLKHGPGRIGEVFSARRREKGLEALSSGMVAIAAGDAGEARRQAVEAEKNLSGEPMTLLLAAQAAELNEDDRAARVYYDRMLARADTEFLGLRGLISRAHKEGDLIKARKYAERAEELRPGTAWVLKELYELALKLRDWEAADRILARMSKGKAAKGEAVKRAKAVISYERALECREAGKREEALAFATTAHELDPTFVPAAALDVALTASLSSARKLQKLIDESWKRAPHRDLAEAIRKTVPGEQPPDWFRRASQTVAPNNPDHVETHMMLAKAAFESRDWGPAREHLMKAGGDNPSTSILRMLAALEEKANADAIAAREWIIKSATAPQDPLWICNACGRQEETWNVHCPACDSFDSFTWRTADRGAHSTDEVEAEIVQEIAAGS